MFLSHPSGPNLDYGSCILGYALIDIGNKCADDLHDTRIVCVITHGARPVLPVQETIVFPSTLWKLKGHVLTIDEMLFYSSTKRHISHVSCPPCGYK